MEHEEERQRLLSSLREQGIGEKVLEAMSKVPRHFFIPQKLQSAAYYDSPLPIGDKQTISAPHMVAIMCDLLGIRRGDVILELGTGSGYNAAVLAELTGPEGHVYSIERIPKLAESAKENLQKAGYNNVTVVIADGSTGYEKHAPYDRICVTSAAPSIPKPLIDQLKNEGIMVIPVGQYTQRLLLVKKNTEGSIEETDQGGVIFVPLVGKYGFHIRE
ncbi:protein-L-isoaspartate(D-aspartate) O-methyltransferase [Methanohalophilus levihalophilus]|uniref:protein-L-isoaspartate O-methyltransferase n=1 Tax=Methanohalophilus levihalophilus TaxID=1431282 RepID=UPI001AE3900D|nr:protein-L-isoaspartate O-methyltransferase [Methanohalophilus levihalophilus]MBP2030631.1 protein-L-isoaspartate(D-aspartate) O-methyltransferase [Methanohalophilus levihalophilus]